MTTYEVEAKPNGPAAAAFLAAGIGAFMLGLSVTLAEAFPPGEGQTAFWDFSANFGIGSGVGPLSGKVIVGTLAYVISFVGLGLVLRGREVNLRRVLIASGVLLALGFALTFPPIFEAFAPPE
jgi:hypothetical protein